MIRSACSLPLAVGILFSFRSVQPIDSASVERQQAWPKDILGVWLTQDQSDGFQFDSDGNLTSLRDPTAMLWRIEGQTLLIEFPMEAPTSYRIQSLDQTRMILIDEARQKRTYFRPLTERGMDPWVGFWRGVEGQAFSILPNGAEYILRMALQGETFLTFQGSAVGDGLAYTYQESTYTLTIGSGFDTGMKWLSDEDVCLYNEMVAGCRATSSPVNELTGKVVYVEDTGLGPMYDIGVVTDLGDTAYVNAFVGAIENVLDFYVLMDKRVTISFDEIREPVAYDMRIADDSIIQPLHETSGLNYPGRGETYSIIGRYVYAEMGDMGIYLEIEGRNGTIYELMSEISNDDWADREVECAVYVNITRRATGIDVLN